MKAVLLLSVGCVVERGDSARGRHVRRGLTRASMSVSISRHGGRGGRPVGDGFDAVAEPDLLVMARLGNSGPYEPGNAYITTGSENSRFAGKPQALMASADDPPAAPAYDVEPQTFLPRWTAFLP